MSKRKILFIGNDVTRSGAPMLLLSLIRWFKANTDWEMALFLPAEGPLSPDYAALVQVAFFFAPVQKNSLAKRASRRILRKLGIDLGAKAQQQRLHHARHLFSSGPPDLIYANSMASMDLLDHLGPMGCPVIVHVHELEYVLQHLTWVPDAMGKAKRNATHFIACADAVKENLVQRHGIDAAAVTTVHAFIDIKAMLQRPIGQSNALRQSAGIPPNAIVIGAVGTMEWRKGADLFIAMARLLVNLRPYFPIYFVWIGGGKPEAVDQLKHDAAAAGLSEKIRVLGATDQIAAWYENFAVLALLSREDPFPLVALEAAAAGVPVVCFAGAGGMPEFVSNDCGAVVPYLDLAAFADAIANVIDNPALRKTLGETAAVKVRADHDVTVAAPLLRHCIEAQIVRV